MAPPGTIPLTDSLYIDQFPIYNFNYLEFLSSVEAYWSPAVSDSLGDIKQYGLTGRNFHTSGRGLTITSGTDRRNRSEPYNVYAPPFYGRPDSAFYNSMQLPDTLLYGKLSLQGYLTHRAYRDYPVIFVSYEQAVAFCKWRTDLAKIHRATTIKDSATFVKKYIPIVKYRLPTAKEWKLAYSESTFDTIRHVKKSNVEILDELVAVDYFMTNKQASGPFQILPMILSEFVINKQIMNANWLDTSYTKIDSPREYSGVSPAIGFRCVCEVK